MKKLGRGSMGLIMCAWISIGCDKHETQSGEANSPENPPVRDDIAHADQGGQQGLPDVVAYDWRAEATLVDVPFQAYTGESYGSNFYKDILSHTKPDIFDEPATTAHETLHGLHSDMRQKSKSDDAFVYHKDGKGLYVLEPKQNLVDVKNHIGASFRELAKYNYDLYLIKQPESWKNTLYLFDEWGCYIATARTAIEAQAAGKWTEVFRSSNSDPLEGLVEFMYFNSAAILSIKNVDPEYLKTNMQYKAAYAMTMEESAYWINVARSNPYWAKSRAYGKLANLQTASDAAPVRAAVIELMGAAWTKKVLGF